MTLESFNQFASSLLAYAGETAFRSIALALAAGLVMKAAWIKQPRLRLVSWTGVLYAAILMPSLGLILPSINIRLLPVHQPTMRPQSALVASTRPPDTRTLEPDDSGAAFSVTAAAPVTLLATSAPLDSLLANEKTEIGKARGAAGSSLATTSRISLWGLALLGYLVVFAAFLARVLIGIVLSGRLRKRARQIAGPEVQGLLLNWDSYIPIRSGKVELAESSLVSVPIAIGVLHPMILLPSNWREWDSRKLSAVLAHESSHALRRDALTQLVSAIHRSIFWFSPLPWWLHRRLIDLAEQASDDSALLVIQDPAVYAEVLLGFFQSLNAVPARWLGVSMARGDRAGRRIDRMLNAAVPSPTRVRGTAIAAIVMLAVALTVPASSIRIGRARIDQGKQTKSARPASKAQRSAPSAAASAPSDPAERQILQSTGVTPSPAPSSEAAPSQGGIEAAPVMAGQASAQVVPAPAPAVAAPAAPGTPAILAPAGPVMALPATAPVVVSAKPFASVMPIAAVIAGAPVIAQEREVWADDGSESFAIVKSNGSNHFSGSWKRGDAERIKALRSKISGDFIWFRHEGRGYIITDPETVKAAEALLASQEDLGRQQAEFGRQQAALAEKQAELVRQMAEAKLETPDLTAQIRKLTEHLKEIERLKEVRTQQQLAELQAVLSELQSKLAVAESQASLEQSKVSVLQSELGRRQSELGLQQSLLGQEQSMRAIEASKKVLQVLERALSNGLAKPEP